MDIEKGKAEVLEKLDSAREKWAAFQTWIAEGVDESRTLLDSGRQPRMPWQDVHACIEGPAVFDICRNFMHRWNAMVWQNQRGDAWAGRKVRDATNSGIRLANRIGASLPEQVSLARGRELTPLSGAWLDAMGGRPSQRWKRATAPAPASRR